MAVTLDKIQKISCTLDKLRKNLQCVICLELLKDPVQTRCRHSFCQDCVSTLLQKSRHPQCPLCNTALGRRGISEDPKKAALVDICQRLTIAVQLDLGIDVESYIAANSSSHEAFIDSPRHKKFGLSDSNKENNNLNDFLKLGTEPSSHKTSTVQSSVSASKVNGNVASKSNSWSKVKENIINSDTSGQAEAGQDGRNTWKNSPCDQPSSSRSNNKVYKNKKENSKKLDNFLLPAPVDRPKGQDTGHLGRNRLSMTRGFQSGGSDDKCFSSAVVEQTSSEAATAGQSSGGTSEKYCKSYKGPKTANSKAVPGSLVTIDRVSSSTKVEKWLEKNICEAALEESLHPPTPPTRSRSSSTSSFSSNDDLPLLSVSQRPEGGGIFPQTSREMYNTNSPADPYEFVSSQDVRKPVKHRKPGTKPIGDETLSQLLPPPSSNPISQDMSDICNLTVNNTFDRLLLSRKEIQKHKQPPQKKNSEKECTLFTSPPSDNDDDNQQSDYQSFMATTTAVTTFATVVTTTTTAISAACTTFANSPCRSDTESQHFKPHVSSTQAGNDASASDNSMKTVLHVQLPQKSRESEANNDKTVRDSQLLCQSRSELQNGNDPASSQHNSSQTVNDKEITSPSSENDPYDRKTVLFPRIPPVLRTPDSRSSRLAAQAPDTPSSAEPFTHFESPVQDTSALERLIQGSDLESIPDGTIVLDSQRNLGNFYGLNQSNTRMEPVEAVTTNEDVVRPYTARFPPQLTPEEPSKASELHRSTQCLTSMQSLAPVLAAPVAPTAVSDSAPQPTSIVSPTSTIGKQVSAISSVTAKENKGKFGKIDRDLENVDSRLGRDEAVSGKLSPAAAVPSSLQLGNTGKVAPVSLAMDVWIGLNNNGTMPPKKPCVTFTLDTESNSCWSKPVSLQGHVDVSSAEASGRRRISIALTLDFEGSEAPQTSLEANSEEISVDVPMRLKPTPTQEGLTRNTHDAQLNYGGCRLSTLAATQVQHLPSTREEKTSWAPSEKSQTQSQHSQCLSQPPSKMKVDDSAAKPSVKYVHSDNPKVSDTLDRTPMQTQSQRNTPSASVTIDRPLTQMQNNSSQASFSKKTSQEKSAVQTKHLKGNSPSGETYPKNSNTLQSNLSRTPQAVVDSEGVCSQFQQSDSADKQGVSVRESQSQKSGEMALVVSGCRQKLSTSPSVRGTEGSISRSSSQKSCAVALPASGNTLRLSASPAVRDTVGTPVTKELMTTENGNYFPSSLPQGDVSSHDTLRENGVVGTQNGINAEDKYAPSATLFSSDEAAEEDYGLGNSQSQCRKRKAPETTPSSSNKKTRRRSNTELDSEPIDSEELMCRVMDAVDRELGLPPRKGESKQETQKSKPSTLEITPGTQLCSQERLNMQYKFDAKNCGPPSYQQTPPPPSLSVAVLESDDDDDDVVEATPRDVSAHSINSSKHTTVHKTPQKPTALVPGQKTIAARKSTSQSTPPSGVRKAQRDISVMSPKQTDSCANFQKKEYMNADHQRRTVTSSPSANKIVVMRNVEDGSCTPQKRQLVSHSACTGTPPRRGTSPEVGTPRKSAPGTPHRKPVQNKTGAGTPKVSLSLTSGIRENRSAQQSIPVPRTQLFVACTGFPRPLAAKIKQLLTSLGIKYCDRVGPETTHVVVRPNSSGLPEKTLKYLQAVAAGKWVVGPGWIDQTCKNRCPAPEEPYELPDCLGGSGPRKSRLASTPLFHDFVFCCVGPFSATAVDDLKELLSLTGALVVESPHQMKTRPQSRHVILAEEDPAREGFFAELFRQYGIAPVSLDWALECISCHSLISVLGSLLAPVTREQLAGPPISFPPECLLSEEEEDDDEEEECDDNNR
ncbi:uncharacterized protein LOC126474879 isoform X1 [Schistocerca serialis cubense]|uniref:uncharacterized protein LOC126474879 isoform X1 n=1 Tax=Schistocerca serialis cubense TaxID=2023355 RepID=UPI00214E3E78|nr:uncharacterized protein LOC126474879 isoform X1 [Schistocerca serialis cubense]